MIFNRIKPLIINLSKNWIVCFIGFIILFGLKIFYSKAGSEELEWILAPTAQWVKILSGITFEKELGIGYVNNRLKFIIAPSCSGIQFMGITFAVLLYSYVHRMGTMTRGLCWTALSLGFSYLFTIFINGFRIVLSLCLSQPDIESRWITPARLHTIEGTAVYFVSLLIIYHIAEYVSKRAAAMPNHNHQGKPLAQTFRKHIPPVFWYLCFTLAIPLLNNAYKNDGAKFMEYAILMVGTCSVIIIVLCLADVLRKDTKGG